MMLEITVGLIYSERLGKKEPLGLPYSSILVAIQSSLDKPRWTISCENNMWKKE
jgi:hypothetical protein